MAIGKFIVMNTKINPEVLSLMTSDRKSFHYRTMCEMKARNEGKVWWFGIMVGIILVVCLLGIVLFPLVKEVSPDTQVMLATFGIYALPLAFLIPRQIKYQRECNKRFEELLEKYQKFCGLFKIKTGASYDDILQQVKTILVEEAIVVMIAKGSDAEPQAQALMRNKFDNALSCIPDYHLGNYPAFFSAAKGMMLIPIKPSAERIPPLA